MLSKKVVAAPPSFAGTWPSLRGPPNARHSRRQNLEAIRWLAGGVAHDINNLLTAIVLNSDILAEGLAEEKLSDLAETTRMCAERASDLTRQFLAVVRDQRLPPRPTDVNAAIAALASLLRRAIGERVELQIAADARRATVLIDPGQLESAILNLALNARDAMPQGGRLAIRTANAAPKSSGPGHGRGAPDMVMIAVSDDGAGMAPEVAARASEPFFTTKADRGGTGLGLSAVDQFLRKAGGSITIDSRPGAGTTVCMLLPVAAGEAPEGSAPEDPQIAERGRESILLVVGDRILRAHVEATLSDLGYGVRGVADALGALTLFAGERPFDLLLTEVVIPGSMSGPELAMLLRRRWPELRVLYTSGYPITQATAAWLLGEPHNAFLAKPFRRRELMAAVRTLLDAAASPRRA